MARIRWESPNEFDHFVLLATDDERLRRVARERLARMPGRRRAAELGGYPRFKVVGSPGREVRRRASGAVTVLAIDLSPRAGDGLDAVRELREARPDLTILAFARTASTSDAIVAVMAGADFFHDWADEAGEGFEHSLELAIDRRRLTLLIERSTEEAEEARGRLAQLSGDLAQAVPGFRPLHAREDILPFREAARRYLLAAAQLFEGDARGLAKVLGVSYFALRRLLARYEVPFPAASRRRRSPR